MTLREQIFAQAMMLTGDLEETQQQMLELYCQSAVTHLTARLQDGLTPDDCKAAFVAAGALYALAALTETDTAAGMQRVQIGDVTLVPGETSAASRCLRRQADVIISPYCLGTFVFRGV